MSALTGELPIEAIFCHLTRLLWHIQDNMNKKLSTILVLASQLFMATGSLAQPAAPMAGVGGKNPHPGISDPQIGIGWGFLYGYLGVKPEQYLPQMRELGADFTKVYLFWNQIEPRKGQYDWTAVDAFVDQLNSPEEGLIALFSSSQWATRQSAAMLPPSPAKNPDDYYRFVHDLVAHYKGRVRYWQNDCEPSNPIYWLGTKEEFTAQLGVHGLCFIGQTERLAPADRACEAIGPR